VRSQLAPPGNRLQGLKELRDRSLTKNESRGHSVQQTFQLTVDAAKIKTGSGLKIRVSVIDSARHHLI
jgi:hypothetical protein